MNENGENRWYRFLNAAEDLVYFNVKVEQSDLYIGADKKLLKLSKDILCDVRKKIEYEIKRRPEFLTSYESLIYYGGSSDIVSLMYLASEKCNVGPMAAVAGATALYVGQKLCKESQQVIVENGGDIYINSKLDRKIAIYAGDSVLSNKIAIDIVPGIWGVCTSAKTIGHSLSFGKCDAAICISKDCALADAAATKLGNMITDEKHLSKGVKNIMNIEGIIGAVAIIGDKIAVAGSVMLSPISGGN